VARAITPGVLAEAERLIAEGLSATAAAKQLGLSESGLRGARRKHHPFGDRPADDLEHHVTEEGFVEIPVIHRDYSDREYLKVYPLGDVHKGSPAHDRDKWRSWVDYLHRHDDCSLIATGDMLNCAIKGSVSETYDEEGPLGEMKRELWAELRPLEGRIDLMLPGNHEARVYRAIGDCPVNDLADHLGAPYVRDVALIVYTVGSQQYLSYVRHGTGGGQVGARANRLQKQAQTCMADFYVSGHTHSQLVFPEEIFYYDPESGRVRRKRRYFVSSGSFLRYEGYAANQAYAPTKIGAPRITLSGDSHDIHVSI
jgi:hypothetical protein